MTCIGALNIDTLQSYYQTFKKTDQFNVDEFIEQLADILRRTIPEPTVIRLVLDNHRVSGFHLNLSIVTYVKLGNCHFTTAGFSGNFPSAL